MKRICSIARNIFLALLAAACATLDKVGPGLVTVGGVLSLTPGAAWNRVQLDSPWPAELWTAEGVPIDVLAIYVGVREGDALLRRDFRSPRRPPPFRASMAPHEIVELFENSLVEDGSRFRLERLGPAKFGGAEGFRFEFGLTRSGDHLEMKGVGYGTVRDGRLYLLTYRAPKSYFFARYLPSVEALARSAQIKR